MARTADAPGTFRVRQKGGEWKLTGLTSQGRRINLAFNAEYEARQAAETLFPAPRRQDMPITLPTDGPLDDWGLPSGVPGLPSVSQEVAGAVGAAMGINPPPPSRAETNPLPPPAEDPEEKKKREQSLARARSLCEFFGIGYAMGVAHGSKVLTRKLGKEPINPPAKNISELGKAATTAFQELVGDWEVGPWTMLLLLTVALPTVMIIQSPKQLPSQNEKTRDSSRSETSGNSSSEPLKAVG